MSPLEALRLSLELLLLLLFALFWLLVVLLRERIVPPATGARPTLLGDDRDQVGPQLW